VSSETSQRRRVTMVVSDEVIDVKEDTADVSVFGAD
jgi:hypothetical protein